MTRFLFFILLFPICLFGSVKVGVDVLFEEKLDQSLLGGKRVGLITNHSAVNQQLLSTFELFKDHQQHFKLTAVFAPEHGFYGNAHAWESIHDLKLDGVPLYGLFGNRRRPTEEMLKQIDVLIYDIQDLGARSYTYASTLFYCMEEAAKHQIPLLVLDRPNPMGGTVVDGPALDAEWRSFIGYVDVPYCHGMTIGELATLFNQEYNVGCQLKVVPMKGWKRGMTFAETGLHWVPTSPQIPESDTAFFYPTTGLIGHCSLTSIGIGYTLPFKLIGAPWIDADTLASTLNKQKLSGVRFQPFHYKPFFGKFKLEECEGVRIVITDPNHFYPMTTQFTIIGVLKQLYPTQYKEAMQQVKLSRNKRDVFHKLTGSEEIYQILAQEPYFIWKLRDKCVKARDRFLPIRKKYLIPTYS